MSVLCHFKCNVRIQCIPILLDTQREIDELTFFGHSDQRWYYIGGTQVRSYKSSQIHKIQ